MTGVHTVLHVWRVPLRRLPQALWRMAADRFRLRSVKGLVFHRLLGSGHGRSFQVTDADPRTWALLTVWASWEDSLAFEAHATPRAWRRIADEEWRVDLGCVRRRGRWRGTQPFALREDLVGRWSGPVASITRATIKPSWWLRFWRSVPPVVVDLDTGPGPIVRLGIGEAPVGVQGTFTVWPDSAALVDFAHRRGPHRKAIADTERLGWYAEELFARFAVLEERGRLFGQQVEAQGRLFGQQVEVQRA